MSLNYASDPFINDFLVWTSIFFPAYEGMTILLGKAKVLLKGDIFIFRSGSVIATFHIETTASNPVSFVTNKLITAISNSTLGRFRVERGNIEVDTFVSGKSCLTTIQCP